jgi:hypothetical protein
MVQGTMHSKNKHHSLYSPSSIKHVIISKTPCSSNVIPTLNHSKRKTMATIFKYALIFYAILNIISPKPHTYIL